MLDRYDRQYRIPGWNQGLLKSAKVAVIGSDHLAVQVLLGLAGLGVGDVMIIDNRRSWQQSPLQFFVGINGASKAESLDSLVSQINPEVKITGIHWALRYPADSAILGDRNVVIETTNSPSSKYNTLMFAKKTNAFAIMAAANETQAQVQTYPSEGGKDVISTLVQEEFEGHVQGALPSGVAAGFVLDRLRKKLIQLPNDPVTIQGINYDMLSPERFPKELSSQQALPAYDLSDKHVLMVGAGSLGNFAALQLAITGVGCVDIVDYDCVESVNLNRQVLLYGRAGEPKCSVLAERISLVNPSIRCRPFETRLDFSFEQYFSEAKPDLILDCVDNFRTRAVLDKFAKLFGIPLVSGGTDFQSGQVVVYVPGQTACLECHLGLSKYAKEEAELEAEHCALVPEPSVIISNLLVGNLMAAEAVAILAGQLVLKPVKGSLKYDSASAQTAALFGLREACSCNIITGGGKYVSA